MCRTLTHWLACAPPRTASGTCCGTVLHASVSSSWLPSSQYPLAAVCCTPESAAHPSADVSVCTEKVQRSTTSCVAALVTTITTRCRVPCSSHSAAATAAAAAAHEGMVQATRGRSKQTADPVTAHASCPTAGCPKTGSVPPPSFYWLPSCCWWPLPVIAVQSPPGCCTAAGVPSAWWLPHSPCIWPITVSRYFLSALSVDTCTCSPWYGFCWKVSSG